MRFYTVLAAAVLIALCAGCESFPGGSPRCSGWQIRTGPVDTNGDGTPDAFGIEGVLNFVVACTIPGEDFEIAVSTEVSGGTRVYRVDVTDGPATGETFKVVDVYDAISSMDQVFKLSGYDMTYTETSNYRDAWKLWLISNWMSASDYHANTGY